MIGRVWRGWTSVENADQYSLGSVALHPGQHAQKLPQFVDRGGAGDLDGDTARRDYTGEGDQQGFLVSPHEQPPPAPDDSVSCLVAAYEGQTLLQHLPAPPSKAWAALGDPDDQVEAAVLLPVEDHVPGLSGRDPDPRLRPHRGGDFWGDDGARDAPGDRERQGKKIGLTNDDVLRGQTVKRGNSHQTG